MTCLRTLLAGSMLTALAAGSPAWAQSDDFNRADAATLGPNWTQQAGTTSISNQAATSSGSSLATYNGASANHISFDFTASGNSVGAAVFGFGSGSDYYLKTQASGGLISTYGFYTGNNSMSGGQGLMSFADRSAASGHFDFSYAGQTATIAYTPTGGTTESYSFTYGFAPGSTSAGIGIITNGSIDNFVASTVAAATPEPATWSLMILGFGIAGTALRRQNRARAGAGFATTDA